MSERLRIYAVEDDLGDARLLERYLADVDGWEVEFENFADSIPALEAIVREPPEVLFLDYQLGGKDGLEMMQSVRTSGFDGPIIILTGQGNEETAVRALQIGASDYLAKGKLTSSALRRSIENSREKHALQQALDKHRTDLSAANRSLTRKNEEIRKFYHVLSHELKSPLTVIREYVTLALDGITGDLSDQQRGHMQIVLDCSDQVTAHVDDLLDVARLETGKLSLAIGSVSVPDLLKAAARALLPAAERQDIRLTFSVDEKLRPARADERRLAQVLHNLVRNAIKFTPAGGRIEVRAGPALQEPGFIEMSVRDTGVGIPQRDHSRIFERLFQSRGEEDAARGGLGLGLPLCRQLVELHGGQLEVSSAPGKGSVFSFTVPMLASSDAINTRPQTEEALP